MATWTPQSKNTVVIANQNPSIGLDFLLLENGLYLFLEDGNKIVLEQTGASSSTISLQSKNTSTLSLQTKN